MDAKARRSIFLRHAAPHLLGSAAIYFVSVWLMLMFAPAAPAWVMALAMTIMGASAFVAGVIAGPLLTRLSVFVSDADQ